MRRVILALGLALIGQDAMGNVFDAVRNGANDWTHAQIDETSTSENVILFSWTGAALAPDDTIRASWVDVDSLLVRHGVHNGSWSISTALSGYASPFIVDGDGKGFLGFAVDSNSKSHISYIRPLGQQLGYATDATGSWVSTDLGAIGPGGSPSASLFTLTAINPTNNRPGILYRNASTDALSLREFNGTSWDAPQSLVSNFLLGHANGGDRSVDFKYDASGNPVIAYRSNDGVHLLTNSGDALIHSSTKVDYLSLAFDGNGRPSVAYTANNVTGTDYHQVGLLTTDGSTWSNELVDSLPEGISEHLAYHPSLLYDGSIPHLSYVIGNPSFTDSNDARRLRYAWNDGAWTKETAGIGGFRYGWHNVLVLDASGDARIVYDPAPVPEPSSLALMGLGALGGLALLRRKR